MERVAPAARADTSIRSAAFQSLDEDFEAGGFGWDLMREPPASVDAIREDISVLRERLSQAAPRRAVLEMDRAISLLSRQMEEMRQSGDEVRAQDNAAVEAELRKLKVALDQARAPARFQALAAGIDALTRKLDALAAKAIDPVEVARLQRQTDEMKDLAARALAPGGLKEIAERIAECAEKVERRGEEMTRRMGEATSAFERSTETLLAKVREFESSYILGGHANAEELRRDVVAEVKSINGRLDQIGEKLATLSPAASSDFSQRLDTLLSRIESVGDVDKAAVAPLTEVVENHLARLTERVRDTQNRLSQLDTIETALARVLAEMELVREAAVAAPLEAAQAVAMKVSEDPEGPAVVGLKRGLAALEARQDELERRAIPLDELEGELQELATDLGRAEHDASLWTPRQSAPPATEEAELAADLQAEAHMASHGAPHEHHGAHAHMESAPAAEVAPDERTARARRGRLEVEPELRAHRAEGEIAAEVQWPHSARRVDWTQGPRRGEKKERKPSAGNKSDRRQSLLLKLLAGAAATLLMVTAAGLAVQQKSNLVAGVTAAVGHLQAQGASLFGFLSPVRSLPTPVGPAALRSAAYAGDVAAAYAVGVRYAEGIGTKVDTPAAEKWLAYAVSAGSAPAAYRLGSLYEYTSRNLKEAKRFYEWAAQQGNVRAMHNLGVLYSQGLDGKPDWSNAIRWFVKSAEMGQTDSQYNLGVIFARGLGGKSDPAEAWKWFALAASQGDADSASKRDSLADRANPDDLARVRQEVESFRPIPYDMAANAVRLRPEWGMTTPEAVAGKAANSAQRAL